MMVPLVGTRAVNEWPEPTARISPLLRTSGVCSSASEAGVGKAWARAVWMPDQLCQLLAPAVARGGGCRRRRGRFGCVGRSIQTQLGEHATEAAQCEGAVPVADSKLAARRRGVHWA